MSTDETVRFTLKTEEAAKYLGLSRQRLAKLRWAGGGPKFVRVGRTVLYKVTDIEAWLNSNRHSDTHSIEPPA